MSHRLAITRTGLVTSVGLTAETACAAMRARVSNPSETRFMDRGGDWMVAHTVPLQGHWRGLEKLARMAAASIMQCIPDGSAEYLHQVPLTLCIAEVDRPGRLDDIDEALLPRVEEILGVSFHPESCVIREGKVSVALALHRARELVDGGAVSEIVICGTDSFVHWPTLDEFEQQGRLLTSANSDGFIPGEGAGALVVAQARDGDPLIIEGLGFSTEAAGVAGEQPLRGDGLTTAIKHALADANCTLHSLDFRVTDLSGEQYYFKEAALAFARCLRGRKEVFELWHPAEFVGETGSAIGPIMIAAVHAACAKAYAPGPGILWHASADDGKRAAMVLRGPTL